jgi:cell division protein ZipA
MDADILRLILLVLGGFLILGIYLWERHKRANGRAQAIRRAEQETRAEPVMQAAPAGKPAAEPALPDEDVEQALRELGDLVGEDSDLSPAKPRAAAKKANRRDKHVDSAEARQQDLFADEAVVEDDHYKQTEVALPTMILQINIVGRKGGFAGSSLQKAIESVEMRFGDMNIYHRHGGANGRGSVLFSMASMVEPGTFPAGAMEGFTTPGLALFAQLPGPQDGLLIFSDMLMTAERLAAELGGELQDETHSRLTKQTVEHIRSQILEHRRKVQLAKSKLK